MIKQDSPHEMNKNITKKLDYCSPALVYYGSVRDLTRSGTGSIAEATKPANGGCWTQTGTKPCASDPCAKKNIVRIGTHPFGIGLYLFDYKPGFQAQWGYGRQFGVMADEVETVMPEAVCVHPDGYKMVNYAMLGIQRSVH